MSALLARGYQGEDLWLYMSGPVEPNEPVSADVRPAEDSEDHALGASFHMRIRRRGRVVAEATVGTAGSLGVVWWIEVKPLQQ